MRMRVQEQEQEQEQEQIRQQAPFRVLSPGGRILYEPRPVLRSPPPARAPEPYKLAPQAVGCVRSQRKSSFAIIAEAQTLAPPSRPSSGRLSPFRGRGFKGPLPRSSFSNGPHSPADGVSQRTGRSRPIGTGCLSQQSSPKRSLIPRADPSRSVSSSKKVSPRFGRRAIHRYTSSIGNSDANHRRPSQRELKRRSDLSPISSASKSKPNKNIQKTVSRDYGSQRIARSEERLNKKLLMPSKNVSDGKRFITGKTSVTHQKFSDTEALDSPSKIPLIQGSNTGNRSSINSLAKSLPVNSTVVTLKNTSIKSPNQSQIQIQSKKTDDISNVENFQMVHGNQNLISKEGMQMTVEDLGLVDLLKQSSGATGTSSVVNTTTTTAVQPLQIDAASILAEGELVAKLTSLEKMQKNLDDESPDSQKSSHSKKSQGNEIKINSNHQQMTLSSNTHNQMIKTNSIENKVNEVNGTNIKNSNFTQTMIKHFGPNSINEDKDLSSNLNNIASDQAKVTENMTMSQIENPMEKLNKHHMEDEDKQRQTPTLVSNHVKPDSKVNIVKSTSKSINLMNDIKKASPSSMINNEPYEVKDTDEKLNNSNTEKKNNEVSLKSQVQAVSSESLGSIRSTDTGVSVNTVRGISSAKEKTGLHLIKRSDEIETLSGNIVHIDKNGENAVPSDIVGEVEGIRTQASTVTTRWQKLKDRCWYRLGCEEQKKGVKNLLGRCCCSCWPKMRCLACKRDPKAQLWPNEQAKGISTLQLTADQRDKSRSRWEKLKDTCRCAKVREIRWCNWRRRWQRRQHQQDIPANLKKSCCPVKWRLAGLCQSLFSYCTCHSKKSQRAKTVRAKHSLTSVAAPPLSEETRPKIPDVLVEHNSLMRGAIPCLPIPVAWFCLMWNVLLPGSGTIFSGFFNICLGQPRFSAVASLKARFGALIVNFVVGISQLFTVLFCLVGWGWSIWWGVTMIRLARKYKRFKDSEAVANDPEARGGPETATLPAPGVPTQALRGIERTR